MYYNSHYFTQDCRYLHFTRKTITETGYIM